MECFLAPKKIHKLTEISLVHNIDGIHSEENVIGYIAEEPFVVLSALLLSYFVSGYNGKLYPIMQLGSEYSLSIKDIGNRYSINNIAKNQISDLSSFINLFGEISLASLQVPDNKKFIQDYLLLLSSIKDNNPTIQKAIDADDIYSLIIINEDEDISSLDYFKDRFGKLYNFITDDPEIMSVILYTAKRIIENQYC